MKTNLNQVDPLHLRLIGASFWSLLFILFIPSWFQHPVNFSPEAVAPKASAKIVPPTEIHAENASLSDTTAIKEERAELYIDQPLTTNMPIADPKKVQSLSQPLHITEALVDQQGKISAATPAKKMAIQKAPATHVNGRFWVQIATYQVKDIAVATQQRIRKQGFVGKILTDKNKKGQTIYLLRVGPYQSSADANKAKEIVDTSLKVKAMVIKK